MAKSDQRKQKKRERQNAKRKERRQQLVRQKNRGLSERLLAATMAPVFGSWVNSDLWSQGIGQVVLSRQLSDGQIAFGMFLVDRYCLGVKKTFGHVGPPGDYHDYLAKLKANFEMRKVPPEDLRGFVEDAVAYAQELGFDPHPDYHRVAPIFGDLDPSRATQRLEMGYQDGKPLYIAGPYDDVGRQQRILATLHRSCGDQGYNGMLAVQGSERISAEGEGS